MKYQILVPVAWCVLYVPLSFLFQQNVHAPIFALIAPVFGFTVIFDGGAFQGNTFKEITLPFLVFWSGLVVSVYVGKKKSKR